MAGFWEFAEQGRQHGRIRFGAFICAMGWLFSILAISYLVVMTRWWTLPVALMALFLLLVGIAMGFWFMNAHLVERLSEDDPAHSPALHPGPIRMIAILLRAIGFCGAAAMLLVFLVMTYPEEEDWNNQFALAIPFEQSEAADPPAAENQQQADDGQQAQATGEVDKKASESDKKKQEAAAKEPEKQVAVMFWSVPPAEVSPHSGLPKMVVACLLLIGFGLIFPHMGPKPNGPNDEDRGMMQSLVVPLVGTFVFGAGAVEQADAEEFNRDIQLLRQDLPPTATIREHGDKIYITNIRELTPLGLGQVERSVRELTIQMKGFGDDQNAINEKQRQHYEELKGTVSKLGEAVGKLPKEFPIYEAADMKGTETALAKLNKSVEDMKDREPVTADGLDTRIAELEERNARWACAYLKSEFAGQEEARNDLRWSIARQDKRAERHVLQSLYVGVIGEDKSDNVDSADKQLGARPLIEWLKTCKNSEVTMAKDKTGNNTPVREKP